MLLLDEPAAGVPKDESGELFEAVAGLSDICVLFIEHDMDVVFRFASHIIVMVGGAILEGSPAEIAADPGVREVYLGSASWLSHLLSCETCALAMAIPSCCTTFRWICGDGSLAMLGRNGVGKSTLLLTIMGYTQLPAAASIWRGQDITRMPPHGRAVGIGWVAQEREIFPSLTVEENLTVAARRGRGIWRPSSSCFPRLAERRRNMGNQLSGGEQQMLAIARALMTNPGAPAARRAARGSGARHRRGTDRRHHPDDGGPAHDGAGRATYRYRAGDDARRS